MRTRLNSCPGLLALVLAITCPYSSLRGLDCVYLPVSEAHERANYVFSGVVVEIQNEIEIIPPNIFNEEEKIYHQKVTFEVYALWKGEVSEFIDIYYEKSPFTLTWERPLEIGETWIIFAFDRGEFRRGGIVGEGYWPEIENYTGLCTRRNSIKYAHSSDLPGLESIIEPTIIKSVESIELDGIALSGNWWSSEWLDTLFIEYYPWVLHRNLGWNYITSTSRDESSWFFNEIHGWIWTNSQIFPWIWRQKDSSWNYLVNPLNNLQDSHWLFNVRSDDWEFFEFENIWDLVDNPIVRD